MEGVSEMWGKQHTRKGGERNKVEEAVINGACRMKREHDQLTVGKPMLV